MSVYHLNGCTELGFQPTPGTVDTHVRYKERRQIDAELTK